MDIKRNLPFLIIAAIVVVLFSYWFIIKETKAPEVYMKPIDWSEYAPEGGEMITIYVTGQVVTPGLYEVPNGSRIIDCIEAAGGLTPNADEVKISLAKTVSDGEQVHVPSKNSADEEMITIYVTGQVTTPGLYEVTKGSRVTDCIEAAGGLTHEADTEKISLAKTVSDGEQVHVPSKSEKTAETKTPVPTDFVKINLNTATKAELVTLPGIGNALAERIIMFREYMGLFLDTSELKEVDGISDKLYESIKDLIYVE